MQALLDGGGIKYTATLFDDDAGLRPGQLLALSQIDLQTEWERKTYNMGVRKPGGAWKTMFAEYAPLCEKLEAAATTVGYNFPYDL